MDSVETPADLFEQAARSVADLVGTIPAEAWAGPGLGQWNLRALVGHTSRSLLTVEAYLAQPAARAELASPVDYLLAIGSVDAASVVERGRSAGAALGDDPAQTLVEIVDRVMPLLDRDDDPLVTTIFGGMRLSDYLPTRTFELVVHGLDIADAIGAAAPAFGPPLWSLALGLASQVAARGDRAPELLRSLTGRARLPEGFSVV